MIGTRILEERISKYNGNLRVVKTLGMGTYIQAGGLTQSGGIVEAIWRQTLRKILDSKFQIHDVLILGFGWGTVAKLIRKKWPGVKITGVEIDPLMIELGKKHLGMDDEIGIKIGDVFRFLSQISGSNLKSKYDLIIVDLYNGDKYPEKFENRNYIHLVRSLLSRFGTVIFNRLYFGDKRPEAVKFGKKLEKIFSKVDWYYPEVNLMLICSK